MKQLIMSALVAGGITTVLMLADGLFFTPSGAIGWESGIPGYGTPIYAKPRLTGEPGVWLMVGAWAGSFVTALLTGPDADS